jgi:hypothetical protein
VLLQRERIPVCGKNLPPARKNSRRAALRFPASDGAPSRRTPRAQLKIRLSKPMFPVARHGGRAAFFLNGVTESHGGTRERRNG